MGVRSYLRLDRTDDELWCRCPNHLQFDRAALPSAKIVSQHTLMASQAAAPLTLQNRKNADPGTLNYYSIYRGFVTAHRVNSRSNTTRLSCENIGSWDSLWLGCWAIYCSVAAFQKFERIAPYSYRPDLPTVIGPRSARRNQILAARNNPETEGS